MLTGDNVTIWDGAGDNPYFAYLAFADHVLVTEDSASMVSEAANHRQTDLDPAAGGRLTQIHPVSPIDGGARRNPAVLRHERGHGPIYRSTKLNARRRRCGSLCGSTEGRCDFAVQAEAY